jgi:hypothetical protein
MIRETKKLNTTVDLSELQNFYAQLETQYEHLCWRYQDNVSQGVGGHILDDAYGWALQSNLEDLSVPCPPYNVTEERKMHPYRDTEMMFGIARKLQDAFPYAHQFSVVVHPPGTFINFHSDSDNYLKVHIPILTNSKAYFQFQPMRRFVLPADGSMVLVNTNIKHGTHNEGETDRIHLYFKIPIDKEQTVLDMEGKI